jgi:hypothetical protein
MKIIITEGQVNLIKEETYGSSKQIKFLKNYYDVEVSSYTGESDKVITTIVELIPKDIDNEMTPFVLTSKTIWSVGDNGRLDYEFSTYIRNVERMPLLDYMGDTHYLNGYLEHLHRSEARKIVPKT